MGKSSPWGEVPFFWPNSPNLSYFRPIFTLFAQIFRGEEIQKSKSGGRKDLEEFELYLPVSIVDLNF